MGMPVSIEIPGRVSAKIFDDLFAICQDIDDRFSPYKTTSELSKLWRGAIKEKDASADMQAIIAACLDFEQKTEGYFSARYAGILNPTGYVKGWAIDRMQTHLSKLGIGSYLINLAGDIVVKNPPGKHWNVAIANPYNTKQPIATIAIDNGAIATSGNYERGSHIYDPHTKQPVDTLASVTIIGPDIIATDVYATAVFAMGQERGSRFIKNQPDYKALFIDNLAHFHRAKT